MNGGVSRGIAIGLVAILTGGLLPAIAQEQSTPPDQTTGQQAAPQAQPPVPGQPTLPPINKNELPENPEPETQATPVPPASQPPAMSPEAASPQPPTGTAAAEAQRPAGNAASRPAGAAIAPPKQHPVRSFLVKLGFIAGAGAAVGTVFALSEASPARVPNTGSR